MHTNKLNMAKKIGWFLESPVWHAGRDALRELMRNDDLIATPSLDWPKHAQVNNWPGYLIQMLDTPNKEHQDEYKLFSFLVRNKLPAAFAVKYCMFWANYTTLCTNSNTLRKHMTEMQKDWDSGSAAKRFQFFQARLYDLEDGKAWKFEGTKNDFIIWSQNPGIAAQVAPYGAWDTLMDNLPQLPPQQHVNLDDLVVSDEILAMVPFEVGPSDDEIAEVVRKAEAAKRRREERYLVRANRYFLTLEENDRRKRVRGMDLLPIGEEPNYESS